MKKLPILIYSIAFLLFSFQLKAQKSIKNSWVDTVASTVYYDGSKIVLDSLITDRPFWLNVLSKDTSLINYFGRDTQTDFAIRVTRIGAISQPLTYSMSISKLIESSKDIATQLVGRGHFEYLIKLTPLLYGKYAIEKISIGNMKF